MFKELVAIVTGGAQGIGKGIVLTFTNSAYIVIADVNKELGLRGKRFTFARLFYSFLFKTDGAKEQDIFYCKKWLIIFGTIHILINNAGKFQHKSFYDVILDE